MLQKEFANHIGDKMFDKDTAKIVRRHAFWGAAIMALPLFGLDWIIYCCILWDMYASLCKRANQKLGKTNIVVGMVVNILIAVVLDALLSFIPVIGWLGTGLVVYLQFYFSGKSFIETIKKLKS